ncbi:MAG: response regulator [FCB group bacterium]|nr:response regulator [FCB group bacterium]
MEKDSLKILVVDDERDVVRYISMVLEDEGYDVDTVLNGRDALKYIEASPPDLICLDVMMPGESGLTLFKNLRENTRFREIPVFIISAIEKEAEFDITNYISDAAISPPERYFEKPIEVDRLISAVKQIGVDGNK